MPVMVGAMMMASKTDNPILARAGTCLLPNIGELEIIASMRVSGKIKAANQASSCVLVMLITSSYPIIQGMLPNSRWI